MTDFNLDTIPLAIVERLTDLDGQIKEIETLNERDGEEIAALRDRITQVKNRIEARTPDFNDVLGQREALAFAVKAYQDEAAPKPQVAGLGVVSPLNPSGDPLSFKERISAAVRSAGYPIQATELGKILGVPWRTIPPVLGVLHAQNRIVRAPEGGWLAAT